MTSSPVLIKGGQVVRGKIIRNQLLIITIAISAILFILLFPYFAVVGIILEEGQFRIKQIKKGGDLRC